MNNRPEPKRGLAHRFDFFNRMEFPVLLAGLLLLGGLVGLFQLTDVARDATPHPWDVEILKSFREPGDLANPIGSPLIESYVRDITAMGGVVWLVLLTTFVIVFLLLSGHWQIALFVLVSVGGGQIVSTLLKLGVDRPRPDLVPHLMQETSNSFPSGHAMMSAVTYLTLGVLLARIMPQRRLKVFFLVVAVLLTFMVGVSRVYLGVHWPTDVIAGWCIGAAWALLCWLAAGRLRRAAGQR